MHWLRPPPAIYEGLSWRQLWLDHAFDQLGLVSNLAFSREGAKRGVRTGTGQRPWAALDAIGAIRPIAFSERGTARSFMNVTPSTEGMTFREDEPDRVWSSLGRAGASRHGVTALYSPWQMLYIDDALQGGHADVSFEVLLSSADERAQSLERLRPMLEPLQTAWHALDAAWRPLMKLLVRVQNRYLPEVTRQTTLLYDAGCNAQVDPWPGQIGAFDAQEAAAELGVSTDQVAEAYWYLVERGLDRDPRDGFELLRRARPRSSRDRWRGPARLAQDHYDAAQVLRLFLTDLSGKPPTRPRAWPVDGRQRERGDLYDRGPAERMTREVLQEELVRAGLYPHGVHVVGEGQCEEDMVRLLVSSLLAPRFGEELGFTDMGGAGMASRLTTMVGGFTEYALRTVVIVDSEGDLADYVNGLVRRGELPEDDCLLFERNLEESNFSHAEMLDVLIEWADKPPGDRPRVTLELPLEAAEAVHQDRQLKAKRKDLPGFAGTLLRLAEDPQYGPVRISKPEFAVALAGRMLSDLEHASDDPALLAELYERRPLLGFVMDRVIPVLWGPSWR
jgi:hypothetical protein